ncbi:MAG: protein kinase [Bradymonadaceae bacterium]|nr:protein kinase [Lujinxingiaceae bacterium]
MKSLGGGRYAIDRVFADGGGMGIIYAAHDTRCAQNKVLIKTTRYDTGRHLRNFRYTADEAVKHIAQTRKILEWEKKVLVRFRNDGLNNLPSPNNFFYDRSLTLAERYEGRAGHYALPGDLLDSEPYLVMEYIDGAMLETRLHEPAFRARLEERLLTLSREVLTALIRLHRPFEINGRKACFLYQDMKPANILVSHDDYFTLIDFGGVTLRLGDRTTEPTAGCITPGYAAPEASDGREHQIDARFDIYTLGATLWHAVTTEDPRELGSEFPHLDPAKMRGKGVSEPFIQIAARALARDPDKRYPSAAAMRKDVMDRLRDLRA